MIPTTAQNHASPLSADFPNQFGEVNSFYGGTSPKELLVPSICSYLDDIQQRAAEMQIHADLSKRAVVDSHSLEWIASPMAGVDRRMLERDGAEVARATSLVRYAPGSSFSAHTHELGEEFLVLDGVFSDETGDFAKGMYVRNPPGSSHVPSSNPGAIILVKLRQMDPTDDRFVRIDTNDATSWQDGRKGEKILPLYIDAFEEVVMLDWGKGTSLDPVILNGGVEYFVVSGGFSDEAGTYGEGTWLRLPAGSTQKIFSKSGARVYRKAGHLG